MADLRCLMLLVWLNNHSVHDATTSSALRIHSPSKPTKSWILSAKALLQAAGFVVVGVEESREASYVVRFLLFRVEIRPFARDVLAQAKGCHAFGDGILDDLFQGGRGVSAGLAGMGVVRERHVIDKLRCVKGYLVQLRAV